MRLAVISGLALAALSGCGALGPSDNQAIVATCMDEGRPEATCRCEADALEKNLPPETFKKFAKAVGREKQNQLEYLNALPVEELMTFAAVTNDLESCGSVPATGE
jgi:hypothetical protein